MHSANVLFTGRVPARGLWILAALVTGACSGGGTPTTPTSTATTSTATSTTAQPVTLQYRVGEGGTFAQFDVRVYPVFVTGSTGQYYSYISGQNGFSLGAATRFTLSQIQVTGTGISRSNYDAFDVEVFMDGKTISLPRTNPSDSNPKPSTAYARSAASQLRFSVFRDGGYNAKLDSSVDMNLSCLFIAPSTLTSTPPLSVTKSLPATTVDLPTNTLFVQTFWWTENLQSYSTFKNVLVTISGTVQ